MSREPEKPTRKVQHGMVPIFMNKTPKLFILAGAVLASLFLFVSIVYNNFVQKSIYEENSRHLLSTYEQVDKTFTMFVQYNWNALSDWSNNLQYLDDTENRNSGSTLPDARMPGNIRIFICLPRTVIL